MRKWVAQVEPKPSANSRSRRCLLPRDRELDISWTSPFLAGVGAGAVTVVLLRDPKALIPSPPYWPWLFAVTALGAFSGILALGLEDGWANDDEVDDAERWRAVGLAYVAGVMASLTVIATAALIDWLEAVN